jgi:isopropylmalate/homocitrate/citramalate synthase
MNDSQIFEWFQFHPQGKWWMSRWNLRPEVMKELTLPNRVIIKDTTLREGEETPNVVMSLEDKMAIARMLSEMGIKEADVGYAGAVERDRAFVCRAKSEGLKLRMAAHARALVPEFKKEIDTIAQDGVDIIQLVLNPVPVEGYKRTDYSRRVEEAVRYAKHRGLFAVFLPTLPKWEMDFCRELFQGAVNGGVDRICTGGMGCLHVTAYKCLIKWIKATFPMVQVGVHVHNDFGLGTACSLAAVEAGAEVVDASVNGMCDRGGIAALEEVTMALTVLYGMDLGIRLDRLGEISRLVQQISGIPVQPYKAVVGENMFTQTTDAHIVAELKGKWSLMNSFDPSFIGGKGRILFGPQSLNGQGLQAKIEAMGFHATDELITDLLHDLENLLKTQKAIPEKEVEQMVRNKIAFKKAPS